jgi:adenylate cyclase
MRKPARIEEFAARMDMSAERIDAYREARLLDPDRDGLFDGFDVLRASLLRLFEDRGLTIEQMIAEIGKPENELTARRIFMLGTKTFTVDEAAAEVGVTREQADQFSAAMGLPPSELLDESDIDALRLGMRFIELGIPWDGLMEGARVYGDAFRKIAQAEINMTHRFFCEPMAAAGTDEAEIGLRFYELGPTLTKIAEELLPHIHEDFLLRALVDHALLHLESGSATELPGSMNATILFVDLALFTPLAQAHGDEVAARILDRFGDLVRRQAVEHGGSVVKQIGDGFMLTFNDPADAVRYGVALFEDAAKEPNFPALRIGVHSGRVLYRAGDYVGNTVNTASRVAAMAMPNVILMTKGVADIARAEGMTVEELGVRSARGIEEPLVLYRATAQLSASQDPVCGMIVRDGAVGRVVHDGTEYSFCSQECLKRFLDDPERYVGAPRAEAQGGNR